MAIEEKIYDAAKEMVQPKTTKLNVGDYIIPVYGLIRGTAKLASIKGSQNNTLKASLFMVPSLIYNLGMIEGVKEGAHYLTELAMQYL